VKIRETTDQDLFAWLRLRQALWPGSSPEQHRLEMTRLRRQRSTTLVLLAVDGAGEAQGFVEVSLQVAAVGCHSSPVGYLEGFFVTEEARNSGMARTLVEAAEEWARSKGCREMASETQVDKEISRTVHRRLGYDEVATHVHFHKRLVPEPS